MFLSLNSSNFTLWFLVRHRRNGYRTAFLYTKLYRRYNGKPGKLIKRLASDPALLHKYGGMKACLGLNNRAIGKRNFLRQRICAVRTGPAPYFEKSGKRKRNPESGISVDFAGEYGMMKTVKQEEANGTSDDYF